ncbi:cytochrome C biogenesis protein CcdA [Facklamia sp. DSM 111018]|uniref:Cytochrome C biogenesis protein CcdA n=1 Tax=Facklamia lactis TaxID=2749967 RepID=A0ABS0LS36_9LACT|nr:cytochrome c biogenesis protein CcdA [Facklamia lactis]MBG9980271.1 cytochrome C biogenesis protein CcdA [Facklamia lactis]MBG9986074.1 cytochrome C biogenesis protein CcdA [Facklamia lactis]
MDYLLLFLEGIMTFISPCLLPMVPLYVAYFAGDDHQLSSRQTFVKALMFMLGFSFVFILMSLFISTVGRFLLINRSVINILAGFVMVMMGIDYLRGQKWMTRLSSRAGNQGNVANPLLFGIVFAVSWTPCVGTFLAAALTYIATVESSIRSFVLILSYCVGLGLPFLISALLIEESKQAIQFLKKHFSLIHKLSGGFLIIFGLLTMSGILGRLLAYLA